MQSTCLRVYVCVCVCVCERERSISSLSLSSFLLALPDTCCPCCMGKRVSVTCFVTKIQRLPSQPPVRGRGGKEREDIIQKVYQNMLFRTCYLSKEGKEFSWVREGSHVQCPRMDASVSLKKIDRTLYSSHGALRCTRLLMSIYVCGSVCLPLPLSVSQSVSFLFSNVPSHHTSQYTTHGLAEKTSPSASVCHHTTPRMASLLQCVILSYRHMGWAWMDLTWLPTTVVCTGSLGLSACEVVWDHEQWRRWWMT
jgi:hypothetical protein